jgi:dTDP-4-dehydrorhamnose reductase
MEKPTILITGSNGQLGKSIERLSTDIEHFEWIFTDIEKLDITDKVALESFIKANNILYLINCAAYTAVDNAEKETELAHKINTIAPRLLAEICLENHIYLIHISTDYVFDGSNNIPYTETTPVKPLGVYGKTKLDGEQQVVKILPQSIIVRTSWLYSEYGKNFAKTMLKLGADKSSLNVIFDQIGTPTYALDLADAVIRIIEHHTLTDEWHSGIYHYSNEGVCSWYDFATEIMNISLLNCSILPIETHEYPTPAKRPQYSVLNKKKIKNTYNLDIPYWRDSLTTCVNNLLSSK